MDNKINIQLKLFKVMGTFVSIFTKVSERNSIVTFVSIAKFLIVFCNKHTT